MPLRPSITILPVFVAMLVVSMSTVARAASAESAGEGQPASSSSSSRLRGYASAGASTKTMFGLPSVGTHGNFGLSIEHGTLAVPLRVGVDLGKTPNGLATNEITVGVGAVWVHERLRLGGGLDTGYGWVTRAASSSLPSIKMFALDAFVIASFDVVDLESRRAIYVAIEPSAGLRWGEDFFAWGHTTRALKGAALAGLRF